MLDTVGVKIPDLPKRPGIYIYWQINTPLYVGKALSLRDRVQSYLQKDVPEKTDRLMHEAERLTYIETGSEFEALLLEANLIKKYLPRYNVALRDDKSYLYIFISTGEEFPKIFLARKPKNATYANRVRYEGMQGEYFGPYTSSSATKMVLKWLRRIFPYCQQKRLGKRACFYHHLGLCSPCPSEIVKLPEPLYSHKKHSYRKNVLSLVRILRGQLTAVASELEKQMQQNSKSQDFEAAASIRDQLRSLKYVTRSRANTQYFLQNPNFYFQKQQTALSELRQHLAPYFPNLHELQRIECYDISVIQGVAAVGAQIVFIDGIPESSLYRRYQIKKAYAKSDVAMMSEVIERRLKHLEWPRPDLLVVDGGKTQVSTISKLLGEKQTGVPLIGLAKREEQIVVLFRNQFKLITLPRKNPALQLLQQVRDETHRFAIKYHRFKRHLLTNLTQVC